MVVNNSIRNTYFSCLQAIGTEEVSVIYSHKEAYSTRMESDLECKKFVYTSGLFLITFFHKVHLYYFHKSCFFVLYFEHSNMQCSAIVKEKMSEF